MVGSFSPWKSQQRWLIWAASGYMGNPAEPFIGNTVGNWGTLGGSERHEGVQKISPSLVQTGDEICVLLRTNVGGTTRLSWKGWGWESAGEVLHFWRPQQQGWLQRGGCGFTLGCAQPPSSSSGLRGGSAEPDAACSGLWELGWALLPRRWHGPSQYYGPSWYQGSAFLAWLFLTLVSPPAFFWKALKNSPCPSTGLSSPASSTLFLPCKPNTVGYRQLLQRTWAALGTPHWLHDVLVGISSANVWWQRSRWYFHSGWVFSDWSPAQG